VQLSIADLIAYRQSRDKLVERVGEFTLTSDIGLLNGYAYVTPFDKVHHMAFVYGRVGDGENVLARLHRADIIRDVFGEEHIHLSAREVEVLHWKSLGKDATEIATILDISPHTVRDYIKSARFKLDCVTSAQAVSKAVKLGLLTI
ncbi:MAG TPA: LuxR C-terminal-related transcriptional regulator, partial [Bauldia sp.]|nr:LuxR C-terminal-related transcriptional regulator [Bauldia sp.]